MKKYIVILILFFTLTILPGCYTVVWSPDEDLSASEKYQEEYYEENNYYTDSYYGDYGYYYQYPWWLSVAAPEYNAPEKPAPNRSENTAVERLRNRDGSRNSEPRERIINNTPVTRSSSGSGSSSGSTSTSTDSSRETSTRKATSSDNSSSNTSTRSSSSGSDNTNRARNNDGGRNSGGRK